MRAGAARDERATPFLLRASLFRLLTTVARAPEARTPLRQARQVLAPRGDGARGVEPKLSDLVAWCEANVERDISVAQFAGRLFLSPAHFARLWKREMGVAPAAYLRRLKLERACFLLEHSAQSVTHIARAVGFESVAHFSRSFRACYGVSPLQFRRGTATH